jgi:hypothetical protein
MYSLRHSYTLSHRNLKPSTASRGEFILDDIFLEGLPHTQNGLPRFIEIECPLYVQPTLEGVHRGLKVLLHLALQHGSLIEHSVSFSIGVYKLPTLTFSNTFDPRTLVQRYTHSLVSLVAPEPSPITPEFHFSIPCHFQPLLHILCSSCY